MHNTALKSPSPKFAAAQAIEYKPGNRNKRVVALILDGLFIKGCAALLFVALSPFLVSSAEVLNTISFFVQSFFSVGYMTLTPLFFNASPGKRIMGLRVIKKKGGKVTFKQMLLRETLGRILAILPLGLGYMWVSFNKERKGFHDMVADTWVVEYR